MRIAAIRLLCRDVEAIARFYQQAFGARVGPDRAFAIGAQRVELAGGAEAETPADGNDTRFQHFAIITPHMDEAVAHLRTVPGWTAISRNGPVRLPPASGGVRAFKFRDPDGHPLELLEFPAGAEPPDWAGRQDLFAGIDHSGISVTDTERSVAFYERLGFTRVRDQVNEGSEQARLDGLDGASVAITSLHALGGPPGVELLRYRAPAPVPTKAALCSVLATRLMLDGDRSEIEDPDGHRLVHARPAR